MTADLLEPNATLVACEPMPGVYLEQTQQHVYMALEQHREVLSSAVLGGGLRKANRFINLKVDGDSKISYSSPAQSLQDYCYDQEWLGDFVGMMTAASMGSLRYRVLALDELEVLVAVTCGLSNARRAGDAADSLAQYEAPDRVGTINITVVSSGYFTQAALAELLMMITEAKCAAMQEADVLSPVSGKQATGTGTDSVAIFNGLPNPNPIVYCGKHTLWGEKLGQAVIELLIDSINWKTTGETAKRNQGRA